MESVMIKMLGLSSRKQGGKNTLSNFLHGHILTTNKVIFGFDITTEGKLVVDTNVVKADGTTVRGHVYLDVQSVDLDFAIWAGGNMWPYIKNYAFADPLKDIAVELFNVDSAIVRGNDEDKNKLTQYKWENMPVRIEGKSGYMTGREFLQYFGTEIFRAIYSSVWVDRTMKNIDLEQPEIAVITDVRFIEEVEAIKKAGGKVVRLTRSLDDDTHESELQLDNYDKWDAVIDTQNLDIKESCDKLLRVIDDFGWTPKSIGKGAMKIR